MANFIGIDLGTTNSAIASYDGENVKIWKSSDGHDVTPSAIFVDKRGNKYTGTKAYKNLANDADNVAVRFKRMMGTNTPIRIPNLGKDLSPEECSAEILKTLFNYLPDEIQKDSEIGVVITVPAAFDQKAKEATLSAANMIGIGKVAFMQEPVAAVMSIMRTRPEDGTFLVYDLGGGTLDVAVATSYNGRVDLQSHGGISVCGGRDFDRAIVDNIIFPWLMKNFKLPQNFWTLPEYKKIIGVVNYAAEQAKIELSEREITTITASEADLRCCDEAGAELYIDIELTRDMYNPLIEDQIKDTIKAVRDTLSSASLSTEDISRIVFVGGPTNYKYLRDRVTSELGIPANTDVNPMTAVAEGASIYAESIDWTTQEHAKKNTRGSVEATGAIDVKFDYIARTPDVKTKLIIQVEKLGRKHYEFQIDSLDSGWSSGKVELESKTQVELLLSKNGENNFKMFIFNEQGESVSFEPSIITIVRTAATIDSIPASHTISLSVLDKLGGSEVPLSLVKAGDLLPKKTTVLLKAGETIKAGDPTALIFNLWEGDIVSPVSANRYVGALKVSGLDFDEGVIPAGSDINCTFEMSDDGNIKVSVSIPCIRSSFDSGKNFYSRQEGQKDFTQAAKIITMDVEKTKMRAEDMAENIDDPDLDAALEKLNSASQLSEDEVDPEKTRVAEEQVLQAKKDLEKVRRKHLREVRQSELDRVVDLFNDVRKNASATDANAFDNLVASAKRVIAQDTHEFEEFLSEMRIKLFSILWKQDWYIVGKFKHYASSPSLFTDQAKYNTLINNGMNAMKQDNIDKLREIIIDLQDILVTGADVDINDMDTTNIIRG